MEETYGWHWQLTGIYTSNKKYRDSRHNHIFFSSVQFEVELQNVKSKVNRRIDLIHSRTKSLFHVFQVHHKRAQAWLAWTAQINFTGFTHQRKSCRWNCSTWTRLPRTLWMTITTNVSPWKLDLNGMTGIVLIPPPLKWCANSTIRAFHR